MRSRAREVPRESESDELGLRGDAETRNGLRDNSKVFLPSKAFLIDRLVASPPHVTSGQKNPDRDNIREVILIRDGTGSELCLDRTVIGI